MTNYSWNIHGIFWHIPRIFRKCPGIFLINFYTKIIFLYVKFIEKKIDNLRQPQI